jgi:hypothetical protein
VSELYDRQHVDGVLRRVGLPAQRRTEILDQIDFPIDLEGLQEVLGAVGLTHDDLINRRGGSP